MTKPTCSTHVTQTCLTRRQLLGTAAAAVAATPIASLLARPTEDKPTWEMRLSTSSLHYRSLPLEEACRRVAALGFEGIDVWSHFEWAGPLCEHLERGVEQLGPAKFATLLQEHKLKLFSASCYSVPVNRFAAKLGELGGCVIVRGSGPVEVPADGKVTISDLKSQIKRFIESLKEELDLAQQYHCTLAIENHSGSSLLNKLDSIKIFTDVNKYEQLGIALAPYHVQLNQESVEETIRAAGSQLKFFYAWQHGEGTDQLPGIGPTDMRPWLRALADIHYPGYVNPFMHFEPEPDTMDQVLGKSRAYLLKIYQELFPS